MNVHGALNLQAKKLTDGPQSSNTTWEMQMQDLENDGPNFRAGKTEE